MKKIRNKFNISKILLEIFSVSFAVLFALGVNEWRNNRANEKLANKALENIRKEIVSNSEIVEETLALNRNIKEKQWKAFLKIKKEIANIANNKLNNDDQILTEFPFAFMTRSIKKTAWNSANLTHAIEYLKFDTVEMLSATYEGQERYVRFNEKILEKLSSPGIFKKETMISELQAYFMQLEMYFQISESLIENYKRCLKEIDAEKPMHRENDR